MNIVLDDAVEEKDGGEKVRIGTVVIRGNSVVMLEVRCCVLFLFLPGGAWVLMVLLEGVGFGEDKLDGGEGGKGGEEEGREEREERRVFHILYSIHLSVCLSVCTRPPQKKKERKGNIAQNGTASLAQTVQFNSSLGCLFFILFP